MSSATDPGFDHIVDVLVIGSGGGGMTAALAADAAGLDTLVVEKSPQFGGSTALSGGGIWVPGAPSQRRAGYAPDPDDVFRYLKQITGGVGQRRAAAEVRRRRTGDDGVPRKAQPMVRIRLEARLRRLLPRSCPAAPALGSTINVPAIDLRKLGDEEQHLLAPLALAPRGIWFAPKDLRLFYQVRQNWRGKAVLVKLIWRMFRARVFGDRMAAIGQSLMARMRLAMKQQDIPLWLDCPDDRADHRRRRRGGRCGRRERTGTPSGSRPAAAWCWPPAVSTTTWRGASEHLPELPGRRTGGENDWSFGNPAAMGDGIRAGEKVGAATDLLDEAWWFPAICWPDGRLQFMLNERMMPSQFVVNGAGQALHQRGGALHGLRPRDDRRAALRRRPTSRAG